VKGDNSPFAVFNKLLCCWACPQRDFSAPGNSKNNPNNSNTIMAEMKDVVGSLLGRWAVPALKLIQIVSF
jgi:hypothetical protein